MTWRRLWPLLVLALALALFFAFRLDRYLSFDALAANRQRLLAWREAHYWLTALGFVGSYIAVAALSVPGATVMTLTGGFLFEWLVGGLLSILGATVGATLVFLAARTVLAEPLKARAGPWLGRMQHGFAQNALSYLLVLRLVPLFPFVVVNLVPAFLGVRLSTFVLATFFGIMPGGFVYAAVGSGLGAVLDAGGRPDFGIIFRPQILLPILGLAVLALLPVVYKRLQRS